MNKPFNPQTGVFKGMFDIAGLHVEDVVHLKSLSTCDKCRQAANVYVLIPALNMWVCEKCEKKIHLWGLSILKRLLGFEYGVDA